MADQSSKAGWLSKVWANPVFAWVLVVFGMAILQSTHIPSLPNQIALWNTGTGAHELQILGYLCAFSVIPIIGLWRLSLHLGLPRFLAFVFLAYPVATVAIYLIWPLLKRIRSHR